MFAAFKTSEHSADYWRKLTTTLKKAFEVAQAIELADTQVKELQHPCTAEVHAVSPNSVRFERRYRIVLPPTTVHRHRLIAIRRSLIRRVPLRLCFNRRSPLRNALLRSDVPLCSHGPHALDADKYTGYLNVISSGHLSQLRKAWTH